MTDPVSAPRLIATTIDCNDLQTMTRFWSELLGVASQIHEPFGFLAHAEDRMVTLWLQRVPEPRVGKNRLHLDLVSADLQATLARIEELGGQVGEEHGWEDFRWRTCMDPEGNVFDVMQAQEPAPEN